MLRAIQSSKWPRAFPPLSEVCCRFAQAATGGSLGIGTRVQHPTFSTNMGTSMPSPKRLDDIIKVDLLVDKTPEEVEEIWMKYHMDDDKGHAGAVLPGSLWKPFNTRARASPNFVLPLGKGDGKSLTTMLQCQLPYVLFTSLEDFKQLGQSAPTALMVTHYPELIESHNLVLARGDVLQPHVVSTPEARTLMALLHAFYSDPSSFLMVNLFNHEPEKFRYEDLLQQLGHAAPS